MNQRTIEAPRAFGYYWVKWRGKWTIAEFDYFHEWWIAGIPDFLNEIELEEIDERQIKRVEKEQD